MNIPSERLLLYCKRLELIIQDSNLPSKWHPIQRAFMKGRICCLNEQIANIKDIMQNTGLTNYYLRKQQKPTQGSKQHPCTTCNNPNCTGLHITGNNQS